MQIKIQFIDNSKIKVFGDAAVEAEIKDHFTFMAPNYKHHPKYKARMWDGKISLYNSRTRTVPAGLKSNVIEYCKDNDIEFELVNFPKDEILVTKEQLEKFIETLDIRSKGNKIEVRDYQFDCILKSINSKRLVSRVPTSGGKSLIIYVMIRWFLENDLRYILIVPNVMLVKQMFSDFADYSTHNGFDVDQHCHKLHSGEAKEFKKSVLISTWQSLSAMMKKNQSFDEILNTYDAVCIDECHMVKSTELTKLLDSMKEVQFRFGTTGTIDSVSVNKLTIQGHIGEIYSAITTKELIDRGQVSNIKIKSLLLNYDADQCKLVKDYDYQQEMMYLKLNAKRNSFLSKLAIAAEGMTLLLVQNV